MSHLRTVSPLSATPTSHHNAAPPQSAQCRPLPQCRSSLQRFPRWGVVTWSSAALHHSVAPQHSAAINAISPSTQCHHTAQRLPYIQCRLLTVPPAPYFNAAPCWDAAIGREPPPSIVSHLSTVSPQCDAAPQHSAASYQCDAAPSPNAAPYLNAATRWDAANQLRASSNIVLHLSIEFSLNAMPPLSRTLPQRNAAP